jgi:hypothetical protein
MSEEFTANPNFTEAESEAFVFSSVLPPPAQPEEEISHLPKVREFISGLRELAAMYESHPELAVPDGKTFNLFCFAHSDRERAEAKERVREVARAFGSAAKSYDDGYFNLKKQFSGGIVLEITTNRDAVCERVVVGTKIEPAREIPAQSIPEHEVEVVEWRCASILSEGDK